jgi:hypothetical protein
MLPTLRATFGVGDDGLPGTLGCVIVPVGLTIERGLAD